MLIANHRLDFSDMSISRFWPRDNHGEISFDEAVNFIADHLNKQMITLAANRKLLVSLTRGYDTRVTLAASRSVKNSVLYFSHVDSDDYDKVIDSDFAESIAREFHLNYTTLKIDNETSSAANQLQQVIRANHYHCYLKPAATLKYIDYMPKNMLHVRSNLIEIVRAYIGYRHINIDNMVDVLSDSNFPTIKGDVPFTVP